MLTSTRTRLIGATHRGGITLVLGAGISIPRGIPNWEKLAQSLWSEAFANKVSPWSTVAERTSPNQLPQFLPIVFELAFRALGPEQFLATLKKHLYAECRYPDQDAQFPTSNESLAVLARLLVQEYKRGGRRRIDAVITLNADDLIEQAVNRVAGIRVPRPDKEIVRVVARSTHSFLGGPAQRPLPVYHLHGFVPSNHTSQYIPIFDHNLVFTDTQYWSVSGSSGSFANRVIYSALGEGRCVFVDLSMTDINLLRWLALRTVEKDRDLAIALNPSQSGFVKSHQPKMTALQFERHFWIHPASDDPSGFLSSFLEMRGVGSVEIDGWNGTSFRKLIEKCFPSRTS